MVERHVKGDGGLMPQGLTRHSEAAKSTDSIGRMKISPEAIQRWVEEKACRTVERCLAKF